MAHADLNAVRVAFRARAVAESARFAAVVAAGRAEGENSPILNKETGLPWTRETLFLALEQKASTGLIETTGRIVFEAVVSVGTGTVEVSTFAQEIAQAFRPGLSLLTSGGTRIYIDRAERLSGATWADSWYAGGVSVLWRAYTPSGE